MFLIGVKNSNLVRLWNLHQLLKFRLSKKDTNFETISHMIGRLVSKRQIKWNIISNFVAFLEKLNFNNPQLE